MTTRTRQQERPQETQTPKRTISSVEAVALTESEKTNLSRETILGWYRAQRLEKLKALQDEIASATYSEKESLKGKVIENTKKELETHRDLTAFEKERQAKAFAEDLIKIGTGSQTIEKIAERHTEMGLGQKLFFETLAEYTGRDKKAHALKNLAKHPLIKKVLAGLKHGDEQMAREIEMHINEGDYDSLKKKIVKASNGTASNDDVDKLIGIASFEEIGQKELSGITTLDAVINLLGTARFIGHTDAMKKAAKDFGVPYFLVLRLATTTMNDLIAMDNNLQQYKYLIEGKENKSPRDIQQLQFIEAVNKMRTTMEAKLSEAGDLGEKSLENNFVNLLDKYLDLKVKEGKIDEQTKIAIKARAKLEDLRLVQLYTLIYAKDEDRERLFFRAMSRIPTMIRFFRRNMGEGRKLNQALAAYHYKRFRYKDAYDFKYNAKRWGLEKILGDMTNLENRITRQGGETGKLLRDTEKYRVGTNKSITSTELYEHDLIMKKYHYLVKRSSEIMTEQAKDLINVGKELDHFKKTLSETPDITIGKLTGLSEKTKKTLFPHLQDNIAAINKKTARELLIAYTDKAVDMRTMHDVTRARFQATAEIVDERVGRPFAEKLEAQQRTIKDRKLTQKTHEGIQDIRERLTAKGKLKRYGAYGALPTFLIGAQIHALTTGAAKPREVLWDMGEAASGFIPIVGTGIDFRAAFSGKSLSGRKLSGKEQIMAFGFGCVGILADVSLIFGGAGMGIRSLMGGARIARRSVDVGRSGKAGLTAIAYGADGAKKGSIMHQLGMGIAKGMDKTKDFEKGLHAAVKQRAQQQASLMSRCGLKETDDIHAVRRAMQEQNINPEKLANLRRLENIMDETTGGQNYLKIFNELDIGRVKVPRNEVSRLLLDFRAGGMPRDVRKLKDLGFNDTQIEAFVQNFDKIRKLRGDREAAIQRLTGLTVSKERKLAELEGRGSSLSSGVSPEQERLLRFMGDERKLMQHKSKVLQDMGPLKAKYKGNKDILEMIEKLEKGEQVDVRRVFVKYGGVEKGVEKLPAYTADLKKLGFSDQEIRTLCNDIAKKKQARLDILKNQYKNDPSRLDIIKKLEQDIKVVSLKPGTKYAKPGAATEKDIKVFEKLNATNKKLTEAGGSRRGLEESIERTNKEWLDSVRSNHRDLGKLEGEFGEATSNLRRINTELHDVNQVYFRFESEMLQKAEWLTKRAEQTRTAAKFMQYGGAASGLIWFLTDKNPLEQVGYGAKGAATGLKYTGKALHEVYIADHSGIPALDVMIDDQIEGLRRQQHYRQRLDQAKEAGESEMMAIAQENIEDPEMQRELRDRGLFTQAMEAMKNRGAGEAAEEEGSANVEYAASDSARKLRERL